MKLKKFNEGLESGKKFHVFAEYDNDEYGSWKNEPEIKGSLPDFYLFEKEEDAFNYLANKLYKIYVENNLDLEILDECEDVVELVEQYEAEIYESGTIDYQLIFYTLTKVSNNIALNDWIKTRRDAKKYNL